MQTNIQTYVETLLVLLIVSLAAYSLIRRFLMPKKVQQLACGGSGCGGSCSGCSSKQDLVKHLPSPSLVAPPKQRIIAIMPMRD